MRLYLTKDEAKRILEALYETHRMSESDNKLINRIERCMEMQKPNDTTTGGEAND